MYTYKTNGKHKKILFFNFSFPDPNQSNNWNQFIEHGYGLYVWGLATSFKKLVQIILLKAIHTWITHEKSSYLGS